MFTTFVMIAAFVGVVALVAGVGMLIRGDADKQAEDRLSMLTGNAEAQQAEANKSLLAASLDEAPNLAEALFSRFPNLGVLIRQSGLPLTPMRFLAISVLSAIAAALVCLVLQLPWWVALLCMPVTATLPLFAVMFFRKRRLAAFGQQLPEALELIGRALRAGHSLAAGINLVAEELDDPVRSEFARCYEQQNLGIPLSEALDEMADRTPNLDLQFFVTAVVLQRQTGGDLAEILDKIGHLIRERFKIWGQIQALTGEGRLSGIILLALPPLLFGAIYKLNPEYVMILFEDPLGTQMLIVGVIMQVIGALVIRKIVNIKV